MAATTTTIPQQQMCTLFSSSSSSQQQQQQQLARSSHHHRHYIHSLLVLAFFLCFTSSLILSPFSFVACETDYYQILGLKTEATDADIKKAYRKLSLKYHPDHNKGNDEAHKKFLEINKAHEVLSDPDKRQVYDLHGEEGLQKDAQRQAQGGGGNSIFDLFGMGGGGGGGAGGRRKGPDFRMSQSVSLEELYAGTVRTFKIARKIICKSCKGSGAKGGETKTCPHCQGRGQVMGYQQIAPGFNIQMQQACDKCGGTGKIAKSQCPICKGQKTIMEEKSLELIIERGMPDGFELKFERASEQSPDTMPGDVIVTLQQQPHPRFTRKGNDLYIDHVISLRDALLGFTSQIVHLDGHRVQLKTEAVTPHDHVKLIKKEGMPIHEAASERGDLYVKFVVKFPKQLTDEQKTGIRALLPTTADATAAATPAPSHSDL